MALLPRRTKYRKQFRGRMKGVAGTGNKLEFGQFGLQSLECGWLKTKQIESARKAITHFIKRGGKLWIRLLADKPVTARAAETRMGGGKGAPDHFVSVIKPGKVLFELSGVSRDNAEEAFRLAQFKLPLKTRVLYE